MRHVQTRGSILSGFETTTFPPLKRGRYCDADSDVHAAFPKGYADGLIVSAGSKMLTILGIPL